MSSIFFYALLRSARQKMTEEELAIASEVAEAADAGNEEAVKLLRMMIHEVLFNRRAAI
jgi:hypothetical protein